MRAGATQSHRSSSAAVAIVVNRCIPGWGVRVQMHRSILEPRWKISGNCPPRQYRMAGTG
jgi:hypothetical protein